jgi:hypothetical protein
MPAHDIFEAKGLFLMLGSSSYPRLCVPNQIPQQTESNISPATLFLSRKMHEIVLDRTSDRTIHLLLSLVLQMLIYNASLASFAENASATGRNLDSVLSQLKVVILRLFCIRC